MSNSLTKHHPMSPNGQDDISKNTSGNICIEQLIEERLSRRTVLKGGLVLAASSFMGVGLTGCGSSGSSSATTNASFSLGFAAVAKTTADQLSIPTGYTAKVLYRLGDPINAATAEYANNGSDTAESFDFRAGDHHDGMHYFGLNSVGTAKDMTNSKRGILCMNHENITQIFLHTAAPSANAARTASEVDKEVNAHGVSVIEVQDSGTGFAVNKSSTYNKRITAATTVALSGPASGDNLMKTKFSTAGTQTRGTLNNCANGYTPWGTFLTCEENWAGYFKRTSTNFSTKEQASQSRYGVTSSTGSYGWANSTTADDKYDRWHVSHNGVADNGITDYRNVANTFGWVVEIDPYTNTATPKKRTALGRFGHEGAMPAKAVAGKPIVYYMGDDARNEYIYKYVSTQNWDANDANGGLAAGDKYLNDGKLYVAKFNADGSGSWIELNISNTTIDSYTTYDFTNQADVLVNSRHAADAVGATPMDRPEWTGIHPLTGDIYVTLTNNTQRGKGVYDGSGYGASENSALDAANPRYYSDVKGTTTSKGNVNGHIIRIKETDGNSAATTFKWDIYLFGAQADASSNVNISALTDDNDFSSPDGLWFSQANPGLMWLQTDDGYYTDVTNCMMLAAMPGSQGDGGSVNVVNTAVPSNSNADQTVTTYKGKNASTTTLKRFLVGPKGCEITGITETPDGKAIFVNIQHPGEDTSSADIATPANYQSHWPATDTISRPRSATVVITKNDGGLIGS